MEAEEAGDTGAARRGQVAKAWTRHNAESTYPGGVDPRDEAATGRAHVSVRGGPEGSCMGRPAPTGSTLPGPAPVLAAPRSPAPRAPRLTTRTLQEARHLG